MATYKVWLKVKDSYGKEKEIDGGTIKVELDELSTTEVSKMVQQLDDHFTTETEVANKDTIKYSDFELRPE